MKNLTKTLKRGFGGGPYNPRKYKTYLAPYTNPTNKEIEETFIAYHTIPQTPFRNIRHVNYMRQSGPLPPHDGPHTMEDIRDITQNVCIYEGGPNNLHNEPEEIMRRVPGITRKEAEHIITLGLTPDEEIDFAYIANNIGLDIYYPANAVYFARQIVTNSKGEKQEIYWNHQMFEDLAMLNVGHAPDDYYNDYHWEIFLWGEQAIVPRPDFDLSVPDTWFEYEEENWAEQNIMEDQITLPDHLRKESSKHPNCNKELFYSQEHMEEFQELQQDDWTPKDLKQNIYNIDDFISNRKVFQTNDPRLLQVNFNYH